MRMYSNKYIRAILLDVWLPEISFFEDPVLMLCDKLHCYSRLLPVELEAVLVEIVYPHVEGLWQAIHFPALAEMRSLLSPLLAWGHTEEAVISSTP